MLNVLTSRSNFMWHLAEPAKGMEEIGMCNDIWEVFIYNSYGFEACLAGLLNYFHIAKYSNYLSVKWRKGLAVQMQISLDQDLFSIHTIDFNCDLGQITYSLCLSFPCVLK